MQKVAIFGGTGMTGLCAVDHAIKQGLQIRLLYRDEATVPAEFKTEKNIELVKGNATNLADVKKVIKDDIDGVVVVLGTRNKLEPDTDMSTGTKNIVKAMEDTKGKVNKVSVCVSSFLFMDKDKRPAIFENINVEHQIMVDTVKASNLDYIAVFPPHIADEPMSEVEVMHDKTPGRVVSKWNLGKFLVDCLSQPEHYRKCVGIIKKP